MANEMMGLLGRKVGMTQMYDSDEVLNGVTVIDVSGNTVIAIRSEDGPDGYNAIQIGFEDKKESRTSKPMKGHFDKAGTSPKKHIRELRLDDSSAYSAGQQLGVADLFKQGERVDVTGRSKGRGFAGVMKKFNFRGFLRTHGVHEFFRHGGSIGTRLTPGMVAKGTKMPGQLGNAQVTIQNLTVARIDTDRNLLFIKGGIPGPNGGVVLVRTAVKGNN